MCFVFVVVVCVIRFSNKTRCNKRRVFHPGRAVGVSQAKLRGGRKIRHVNRPFVIERFVERLRIHRKRFRHFEENVRLVVITVKNQSARAFRRHGNG